MHGLCQAQGRLRGRIRYGECQKLTLKYICKFIATSRFKRNRAPSARTGNGFAIFDNSAGEARPAACKRFSQYVFARILAIGPGFPPPVVGCCCLSQRLYQNLLTRMQ